MTKGKKIVIHKIMCKDCKHKYLFTYDGKPLIYCLERKMAVVYPYKKCLWYKKEVKNEQRWIIKNETITKIEYAIVNGTNEILHQEQYENI